jgi:tetratricopeptide (TPR) repeat protein
MKNLLAAIVILFSIPAFSQTAKEYYAQGCKYYLESNFKDASKVYAKALEMEKKKRTLDKENFYVLIDNLSIAYGISGNLKDGIKTCEYGISIDSAYPMFYYNLACCYAGKDDIDRALDNLSLAYKYKKNMLNGEQFPDPNTDDSFTKYKNNDKFKKVVNQN